MVKLMAFGSQMLDWCSHLFAIVASVRICSICSHRRSGRQVRGICADVDFTGDGFSDVAVGRDDGSLEARFRSSDPSRSRSRSLFFPASLSSTSLFDFLVRSDPLCSSPAPSRMGSVLVSQVYSFDSAGEPRLAYRRALAESVTAVGGGWLTRPERNDLAVTTSSGKARAPAHSSAPTLLRLWLTPPRRAADSVGG